VTKPKAWAVLDLQRGRWSTACDECTRELGPTWLPGLGVWGGWQGDRAVVLVPVKPDRLHRGDDCDLCPSHGRRGMWDGARWTGQGRDAAKRSEGQEEDLEVAGKAVSEAPAEREVEPVGR
jgi:hypothetical protein